MGAPEECLHAVVRGRVQGVGFRFHTQERAQRLGLNGWVKNLPDGSVEVMAAGPRPVLEDFLRFLRVGPNAAGVAEVRVNWTAAPEAFRGFEVRY